MLKVLAIYRGAPLLSMQILTSTLLKILLVSERPTYFRRTYPSSFSGKKTREREKVKRNIRRKGRVERILSYSPTPTRRHQSYFPRDFASLNLSEFKFNEKYTPRYALKNR